MKILSPRVWHVVLLISLLFFNAQFLNAAMLAPINKVKVAFIVQFLQFVKWPLLPREETLNICAYGDDKVTHEFELLSARQDLKGRFNIHFPNMLNEISTCNILYIAESSQYQLEQILGVIKNKPVLTVSSLPEFVKHGGVIGFINIAGNVRMEINRYQAEKNNIIINAKLLEVANLIIDKESEDN